MGRERWRLCTVYMKKLLIGTRVFYEMLSWNEKALGLNFRNVMISLMEREGGSMTACNAHTRVGCGVSSRWGLFDTGMHMVH